jgi:hypothetical protein
MVVNNRGIQMQAKSPINTMNELDAGNRIESQITKAGFRAQGVWFQVERLAQTLDKVAANILIR